MDGHEVPRQAMVSFRCKGFPRAIRHRFRLGQALSRLALGSLREDLVRMGETDDGTERGRDRAVLRFREVDRTAGLVVVDRAGEDEVHVDRPEGPGG